MAVVLIAAAGATLLIVLGFLLAILSAITLHDVPLRYELVNRPISDAQAGDLHAVSPDGLRSDWVCRMQMRAQGREERSIDREYVNMFAERLPLAGRILNRDSDLLMVVDDGVLRFIGEYTELRHRSLDRIPDDCQPAVLESFLNRKKLCIVDRSLSPKNAGVAFSAFRYKEAQLKLPREFFEHLGVERPAWANEHSDNACPPVPKPTWPVLVRHKFGVVVDRAPREVEADNSASLVREQ